MSDTPFVQCQLAGFFDPVFVTNGRILMTIEQGAKGMLAADATPPTRIRDARHLQADAHRRASFSESAFFDKHGFVLLRHDSAVTDWDVDPATPEPDNALTRVYGPEIESLIRTRLLPGRRIDVWHGPPTRRGPGTPNPEYAGRVHQDFGLTPDDYQEAIEIFTSPESGRVWRNRYERADVVGFVSINFWRTVGMTGPLRYMPLSICHPASVRIEDVVSTGLIDVAPGGKPTNQSGLRYDAGQRWYYYPEMTPNEVLAFKQFQFFKDDPEPKVASCFHSAFELPDTPADAEERQSSEHRVLVFLLKDE